MQLVGFSDVVGGGHDNMHDSRRCNRCAPLACYLWFLLTCVLLQVSRHEVA